ncbi:MAG: hypothetical protein IJZ94_04295 [Clostridia bacterium]|nr:hypothetical protein [Clostridia bacterium]
MEDIRFEVLMYDKTANVIDLLIEKYGWTENVAIERFTQSEVYSLLERQETGFWKLSDTEIAEKFFDDFDI